MHRGMASVFLLFLYLDVKADNYISHLGEPTQKNILRSNALRKPYAARVFCAVALQFYWWHVQVSVPRKI
jgi:hypothetical protein